LLGVNPELLS